MPNTEYKPQEVYDKYLYLKKALSTNITNKGVTASQTELYDNLIDKVAQIENLKGEERTLENFTNVLNEPKSIVQLEYPEPKNLFDKNNANIIIGYPDAENIINPAPTTRSVYISCTPNTTYTVSKVTTARFAVAFTDVLPASNVAVTGRVQNNTATSITATSGTNSHYIVIWVYHSSYDTSITLDEVLATLQIEKGATATPYEPYPAPKTLNAKLSSKNLIPYPYVNTTKTLNGITFTVNSDGSVTVNGTATAQSFFKLQQSFSLKKGQYFFSGCPAGGSGGTYSLYLSTSDYKFYKPDIGNGISINAEDDKIVSIVINIAKNTTVENLVFKPQLELGTTATAYTPYISDFPTVNVTRCGKNLFDVGTVDDYYVNPNATVNLVISDNSLIGTVVSSATSYIYNTKLKFTSGVYTFSSTNSESVYRYLIKAYDALGNILTTANLISGWTFNPYYNGYFTGVNNVKAAIPETVAYWQVGFVFAGVAAGTRETYSNIQIELGSTATPYEPYQGQNYTPTTTGDVKGITNLYPTTTLLTDNAGVVFEQVTGGFYKEILPSTDKNGITKVYQPSVDSSIDSNIKPENIKKGVKILGILGTYDEGLAMQEALDAQATEIALSGGE